MIRKPDSKGWYWKNKPRDVKDGLNCCASDPIAIHGYKSSVAYRAIFATIFTLSWGELQAQLHSHKEGGEHWNEQQYLQAIATNLRGVSASNSNSTEVSMFPPDAVEAYWSRQRTNYTSSATPVLRH